MVGVLGQGCVRRQLQQQAGQLDRWSPWSSLAFRSDCCIGLLRLDSEQPIVEREASMGHSHPRSGRRVLWGVVARVRASCCCGVVLAGTSPTTHPQALSVPLGTACLRRVAACYASPDTLPMADLAQCCCDNQGRSLFPSSSRSAGIHVRSTVLFPRQPASRHPNCFRFLLMHGRWAACDRCDRGPRTPPIVLLAQKMSMSSASLCCRCTESGVRPI